MLSAPSCASQDCTLPLQFCNESAKFFQGKVQKMMRQQFSFVGFPPIQPNRWLDPPPHRPVDSALGGGLDRLGNILFTANLSG